MHFRRDGAVYHGVQVAPDGGQGRTEIMGNICHKLFLVILCAGNLARHIVQTARQVSDFVLALHLELIVHVAGGVLLCGIGDLSDRHIHQLRKKYQDDQGQQEQYYHCNI